jgi:hypothetical protein
MCKNNAKRGYQQITFHILPLMLFLQLLSPAVHATSPECSLFTMEILNKVSNDCNPPEGVKLNDAIIKQYSCSDQCYFAIIAIATKDNENKYLELCGTDSRQSFEETKMQYQESKLKECGKLLDLSGNMQSNTTVMIEPSRTPVPSFALNVYPLTSFSILAILFCYL